MLVKPTPKPRYCYETKQAELLPTHWKLLAGIFKASNDRNFMLRDDLISQLKHYTTTRSLSNNGPR